MFDWAGVSYSKVSIVEIGTSWARRQELSCFPTQYQTKLSLTALGKSIVKTFFDTILHLNYNMVKGGRGGAGRGTKPGRGGNKSRKSADTTGIPTRLGELDACKDLEEIMFILSFSNKAKDGDVF